MGQEAAQVDPALTPSGGEGYKCWVVPQHGAGCPNQPSAELSMSCHLLMGLLGMGCSMQGMSPTSALCLAPSQHTARQPLTNADPLQQLLCQSSRRSCKLKGAEFQSTARCFGPFEVLLAGISERGDGDHKPLLLPPSCHFYAP